MTQSIQMFGMYVMNEKMKDLSLFYERYTSSKDNQSVYASLLVWPKNTTEITLGAPVSSASTTVALLGSSGGPLTWRSAGASGGIIIDVSNVKIYSLASDWAWVFKLQNVTPKQTNKKL
jgi:Alpha-L-fucosidase C-terminal domain